MRVAMVIPAELQELTGNAVDVLRWQAQARDSGFEIVTIRQGASELPTDVDLVHAIHTTKGGVDAAALAGDRLPLVVNVCGSDFYLDYHQPRWKQAVEETWRRADAIVLWHDGIKADMVAIDRSLSAKLRVIGPSVRLDEMRRTTRASWGIGERDPLIVLPASIRAPKDPLYPLPVLDRLRARFPRLRFLIAGAVRDAGYQPEVHRELARYPWAEFIGAVPRAELLGLLSAADVVLNTSPEEGFANSVLEAMVVGAPLLLRDNAGNRAAVLGASGDAPAALFFSTPADFEVELTRMLGDPELRTAMGRAAGAHARARFSEERERLAYRDLYRSLVSSDGYGRLSR
jgi:glycosyltransferase involved in cell wall biosynthesis